MCEKDSFLKIEFTNQYEYWKSSKAEELKNKIIFSLGKSFILPIYEKNQIFNITLRSKTNVDSLLFKINLLDKKENLIHSDSIFIMSEAEANWSEHSLRFQTSNAQVLQVIIKYDAKKNINAKIGLDKINFSIISAAKDFSFHERLTNEPNLLNPNNLVALSIENPIFSSIKELRNKKLIALGECTHGSQDIKNSIYDIIKYLITEENCKLVLLESPMDLTLLFDLYIQGLFPTDKEDEITEALKGFFTNYETAFDFFKWLRAYNSKTENKVHLIGIDDNVAGDIFLADYFSHLSPGINSMWYITQLAKQNYEEVNPTINSSIICFVCIASFLFVCSLNGLQSLRENIIPQMFIAEYPLRGK